MATEAQRRAIKKYKQKADRMTVDFYPTEKALFEHLSKQEKKQTYIKDLIRADEDGRLLLLPCKVGEKVYCVTHVSREIIEDIVEDYDIWSIKNGIRVRLKLQTFNSYIVGEFGKNIFLTREEAEKAAGL